MTDIERREKICPDCHAGPGNMDARITSYGKDPDTDTMYSTVTWHSEDCPTYTVERILMEEGVRRAKEKDEWAKQAFPAAVARFRAAAAEADGPFAAALRELVEQQAEDTGRYVPLDRWAEILDRHFPPGEEPTT
jgi:hypothetical protein